MAEDMGLNGTPSYVIGRQVVVGAVGVETLKEKIAAAKALSRALNATPPGRLVNRPIPAVMQRFSQAA